MLLFFCFKCILIFWQVQKRLKKMEITHSLKVYYPSFFFLCLNIFFNVKLKKWYNLIKISHNPEPLLVKRSPSPSGPTNVVQSPSCVRHFLTPWTSACRASLSPTISCSLLKFLSIESVIPSNHLTLCRPLLLLPSIIPSIRVFSNESALHIKWPKS